MKYLYIILAIILIVSGMVLFELNKKEKVQSDIAILINNKVITKDELEKLYQMQSSYKNKEEFINTLITKELLIQESQKEGIDKEEPFRRSIQNYYEQSLIKLLIDRKFSSLKIDVKDSEINRYIDLMNKKVFLTIYNYKNLDDVEKERKYEIENITANFSELSQDIRCSLASINKGDATEPLKVGERYLVIRLENTEDLPARESQKIDKESVKKIISEFKKDKLIEEWINSLRKKAAIKIYINNYK